MSNGGNLLPYGIWYENSAGDAIRLDEAPIVAQRSVF